MDTANTPSGLLVLSSWRRKYGAGEMVAKSFILPEAPTYETNSITVARVGFSNMLAANAFTEALGTTTFLQSEDCF